MPVCKNGLKMACIRLITDEYNLPEQPVCYVSVHN